MFDRETRNNAVAALCIMLGFGIVAYFLPRIMIAVGNVSTVLAALVAIVFVLAFFLVFWLRSRRKGN